MAVQIERIAMILSALRIQSTDRFTDRIQTELVCSDEDYATAELIGNKLILHMAQAYQMIKGTQKIEQPKIKPLDQKQILLSLLPEEFDIQTLVSEAKANGLSHRTATRWNEGWVEQGVTQKIRHGVYKKCLAVA